MVGAGCGSVFGRDVLIDPVFQDPPRPATRRMRDRGEIPLCGFPEWCGGVVVLAGQGALLGWLGSASQ